MVLWALLPAVIIALLTGDTGSILLLIGVFVLAIVLRESVSLSLAILTSLPLAIVGGFVLTTLNGVFLEELVSTFNQALAQIAQDVRAEETGELAFDSLTVSQVAALLATGNAVIAVMSLLLGRFWQAALFNPGGFGGEFRALRLPKVAVLGMIGLASLLWWLGPEWMVWSAAVVLPLTIAGFALVHAYAVHAGKSATWLTLIYMLWVVLDPAKWLWVGCVVVDAFVDFRARWAAPSGGGSNGI